MNENYVLAYKVRENWYLLARTEEAYGFFENAGWSLGEPCEDCGQTDGYIPSYPRVVQCVHCKKQYAIDWRPVKDVVSI